jgi:hypothetical protein
MATTGTRPALCGEALTEMLALIEGSDRSGRCSSSTRPT